MFSRLFIAVTVVWSCVLAVSATACSITLPDDIQGFAPVLLTRGAKSKADYALFKPTGKTTQLREGTSLLLACTGKKNSIKSLDVATLELTCSGGRFVDANNNDHDLKDLVCNTIPSSTLKLTSDGCSQNRGHVFEAGFEVDKQFYGPVFEICYDNVTENTFYTHNTINGAVINYSIKESTRRPFTAEGMKFSTTKTNNYYKQKNQVSRFEKDFGSNQNFIEGSNYLARGHLTPDADFIFGYEQLSTYYFANVAPQYQTINAGNWLRVEDLARTTAASYGDDIESYNGYIGQLQLPNQKGKLVDIYLEDTHQIEAPKYYFKVLVHKPTDAAIVFVSSNSPFIADGAAVEICENVCEEANLKHNNFPDLSKGYTFCCRLEDFKVHNNDLPSDVKARNLLKKK